MIPVEWTKAACKGEDPELWFREYSTTLPGKFAASKAKAICEACPIREQCLESALIEERGLGHLARRGIRGGMTGRQRQRLAHRLGIVRDRAA